VLDSLGCLLAVPFIPRFPLSSMVKELLFMPSSAPSSPLAAAPNAMFDTLQSDRGITIHVE
jgi:hypothetical protein